MSKSSRSWLQSNLKSQVPHLSGWGRRGKSPLMILETAHSMLATAAPIASSSMGTCTRWPSLSRCTALRLVSGVPHRASVRVGLASCVGNSLEICGARAHRASAAGWARCGPVPGSGSSRRRIAPPRPAAGSSTARRCLVPCQRTGAIGHLEGLREVRLEPERAPALRHHRLRQAHLRGHRPRRSVRRALRSRLQRLEDHLLHLVVAHRARRARPRLVVEPVQSAPREAPPPLRHRRLACSPAPRRSTCSSHQRRRPALSGTAAPNAATTSAASPTAPASRAHHH